MASSRAGGIADAAKLSTFRVAGGIADISKLTTVCVCNGRSMRFWLIVSELRVLVAELETYLPSLPLFLGDRRPGLEDLLQQTVSHYSKDLLAGRSSLGRGHGCALSRQHRVCKTRTSITLCDKASLILGVHSMRFKENVICNEVMLIC